MKIDPVVPFEPVSTNTIPSGEEWVYQVKWDGVRILTYFDGREVALYNRKLNARTAQFPEFLEIKTFCTASSVVLDGEVIALFQGKPSFHEVMKRDGARKPGKINQMRNLVPVTYMIFDILYYNGNWITDLPLFKRQQILKEIIIPRDDLQLTENFSEGENLFETVKKEKMEGIVCKDLRSKYLVNGKDKRWQKKKNYKDIAAVVGGVTLRGGVVSSLLLGLYDENRKLKFVGQAGTGKLTSEEWLKLTKLVELLKLDVPPFVNVPVKVRGAVWLEPKIAVRIKFIEWTKNLTLRQPSIQAFLDISPDKCTFE